MKKLPEPVRWILFILSFALSLGLASYILIRLTYWFVQLYSPIYRVRDLYDEAGGDLSIAIIVAIVLSAIGYASLQSVMEICPKPRTGAIVFTIITGIAFGLITVSVAHAFFVGGLCLLVAQFFVFVIMIFILRDRMNEPETGTK